MEKPIKLPITAEEKSHLNIMIGLRLQKLRNALNLKQARFSEQIGCSQQQYAKWETGLNALPVYVMLDIQQGIQQNHHAR